VLDDFVDDDIGVAQGCGLVADDLCHLGGGGALPFREHPPFAQFSGERLDQIPGRAAGGTIAHTRGEEVE
jgi:hypothetical protein